MSDNQIKELKKKLEIEKKRAEEYLAGWQRAKADYLNREREIEKKKTEWIKFASLELVLGLLPLLDSFNQFLSQIPEEMKKNQWIEGVFQVQKQLEVFLGAQGVEKIKTVGQIFDPELHEAIEKSSISLTDDVNKEKKNNSENPEDKNPIKNVIIEEAQAGYKMHNKVIRPAKVIVN